MIQILNNDESNKPVDWTNEKNIIKHKIGYGAIDYKWRENTENATVITNKYATYNGDFVRATGDALFPYTPANYGITWLSAHLEAWNRQYAGYASAGVRIKGRKNDGRWRDDAMTYAGFTWEGRGRYWFGASGGWQSWFFNAGSEYGSNTDKVGETCFYCVGLGCLVEVDYIEADFTYEDTEGRNLPRVYRYDERFTGLGVSRIW